MYYANKKNMFFSDFLLFFSLDQPICEKMRLRYIMYDFGTSPENTMCPGGWKVWKGGL